MIVVLAARGALAMARRLKADAKSFQNAKGMAVAALTLGFLLYGPLRRCGWRMVRHLAGASLERCAERFP